MSTIFMYPRGAMTAFADVEEAMARIGRVTHKDEPSKLVRGKARFGLQAVEVVASVEPNGEKSLIAVGGQGDDIWGYAEKKVIQRFLSALPFPVEAQATIQSLSTDVPESESAAPPFTWQSVWAAIPVVIALATAISIFFAVKGGDTGTAASGADTLIMKTLRSPSSYSPISHEVIVEKPLGDFTAYLVKVEYDAANGFGAIVRDCKHVVFKQKGERTLYDTERAIQPCLTPDASAMGFSEAKWREGIMDEAEYQFANSLK